MSATLNPAKVTVASSPHKLGHLAKPPNVRVSSSSIKQGLENSSINKLPVRKELQNSTNNVAPVSRISFLPTTNTTTTKAANYNSSNTLPNANSLHRKNSFNPYSFTSNAVETGKAHETANSESVSNIESKQQAPPVVSKLLRFNSARQSIKSSNLKTFSAKSEESDNNNNNTNNNSSSIKLEITDLNGININIKREDSAYCSSTSSTASSGSATSSENVSALKSETTSMGSSSSSKLDEHTNNNSANVTANLDDSSLLMLKKSEENLANNPNHTNTANKNESNIQESIGELNHLMLVSSSSIGSSSLIGNDELGSLTNHSSSVLKQRRTSSASLNNAAATTPGGNNASISFKMPSNLPPPENGEVITIDLETYRLLIQDLQDCKLILHKLASILKEPSTIPYNGEATGMENQLDDLNNPLLSSLLNFVDSSVSKSLPVDQSTQTEPGNVE